MSVLLARLDQTDLDCMMEKIENTFAEPLQSVVEPNCIINLVRFYRFYVLNWGRIVSHKAHIEFCRHATFTQFR